MSTVNREIALVLLKNDGYYPGDPQVFAVYRYVNDWDGLAYRFSMHERDDKSFHRSEYIHEPVLLWNKNGLTEEGKAEIENRAAKVARKSGQ